MITFAAPRYNMISHDELGNILTALGMTGGCDLKTLVIVAQSIGLVVSGELPPPTITVELPQRQLSEGMRK